MPRGRNWVMGEQLAQVDNRDPFAVPVWRSPVYRTPEPVIMVVQLVRLICRVLWFVLTDPAIDAVAVLVVVTWLGRAGPAWLAWPRWTYAGTGRGSCSRCGPRGSWRCPCGTGGDGGPNGAGGRRAMTLGRARAGVPGRADAPGAGTGGTVLEP